MSEINELWKSAKAGLEKEAGLRSGLKEVVEAGSKAFHKIKPTEGNLTGVKTGIAAAKSKAGELLGGKQKIDGSRELLRPLAETVKDKTVKAWNSPATDAITAGGIGVLAGEQLEKHRAAKEGETTKAASDISSLWDQAKVGMTKAALNPGTAIQTAKKALPGLLGETKAVSTSLSVPSSGLSKVTANIDEVIPAMRQAKGRVIKPSVAESGPPIQLSGTAAPTPMKTLRDHLGGAKGKWDGLSAGTRTGIKGTALVGGLGLSNAQGRSAGKETGMEIGSEKGYDAGFANASQQAAKSSMDPGVLGRLMEVFTGRQPAVANGADPEMAARRQFALKRILAGG